MTDPETQAERPSPSADMPPGPPSLAARLVKSAGWAMAGKVLGRGVDLVKIIVVARLLSPEDIGLFGIVLLAIVTIETFTRTGFDRAIIQRRDDAKGYLDTAWTVQVIRGLILAALLFAAAPAVGWFFEEPRVVLLLQVMGISVAVRGLVNIGIIYFEKELEFHKQFVYNVVGALVSLAVAVFLVYRLRSVWALVWAGLAGAVAQLLLSYVVHPYRPRARFEGPKAAELFRFGRWVLGFSALVFLATHGDDVFLAKMLGVGALGIYQMAYRISNLAATGITHTISSVTFPGYSKIQDDVARFRHAYLRVLAVTMLLAAPVAAGTAAVAPTFVRVVMGAKWAPAIVPIQLLCIFGLLRAYGATTGPVCYASGNPRYQTIGSLMYVPCMFALIWPLTVRFGVPGTCVAVTIPMIIANAYVTWRVLSILRMGLGGVLKRVLWPVLASLLMFVFVLALGRAIDDSVLGLVLMVVAGSMAYFVMVFAGARVAGARITARF